MPATRLSTAVENELKERLLVPLADAEINASFDEEILDFAKSFFGEEDL